MHLLEHLITIRPNTPLTAVENCRVRLGPVSCLRQATLIHEHLEVLLGIPVPWGVGREEEIHLLEGALVGLWVECPNHRERDSICDTENIQGLLSDGFEHYGA